MRARYLLVVSFLAFILFTQLSSLNISNVAAAPTLTMNSSDYTPFDRMIITLTDSRSNSDSDRIDTVQVTVAGGASTEKIPLRETGYSTGVFSGEIKLSPDLSKFPGDMQVRRDDGLTVSFRADADNIITETVFIVYHEGVVSFDSSSYQITEEARVSVTDRDANMNPNTFDVVGVKIWSSTDVNGLTLKLRETDRSSGIFEEHLLFTLKDTSSGNRLKVADSDVISVRYTDNTLPQPAKLAADGIQTLDVKDVVATSIFGKQIPSTQRAPASEPVLLNSFGGSVTQLFTGEQVLIQSQITNKQDKKQPFAYLVQVKDSSGITVSLSWVISELPASDSLNVAQSWLPNVAGQYTVEIFVWESLQNPTALSPIRVKNIQVF
ncbi:MAG: hypothetical protein ACE5J2_04300 [Nitrososphaerales archaeon]